MTALAISIAVEWVVLMVVLPIAQRLADFALPDLVERSWKLLVIIVASTLAAMFLGAINPLVGMIASVAVFWIGMVKVFDVDMFGAVIIVVIRWLVNWLLVGALVVALTA